MKAKRVLAMILSVALTVNSASFTLDTRAAEAVPEQTAYVEDVGAVSWDVSGAAVSDVSGDVTTAAEEDVSGDVADAATKDGGDVSGSDVSDSDLFGSKLAETQSAYFDLTADGTLKWKDGVSADTLKSNITVSLPAGTVKIPVGIFNSNTKIVGMTIPDGCALAEIEAGAFERSGVKSIKDLPAAVKVIGEGTFKDSKLQTISFASGSQLTTIGKEAFSGSNLTSITIPEGVDTVNISAFKGCTELSTVNLTNVSTVEADAFKGCSKLNVIGWSTKLTAIKDGAFSGCAIAELKLAGSTWAGNVTWGDNVFEKNKSLTKVSFPDAMTKIPYGMFSECIALTSVTLTTTCTSIEGEAFADCTALKKITIPKNVSRIASRAFAGCKALEEVTINQQGNTSTGESTIVIATDAFPVKTMTMKGYDGTVEDYADMRGYTFKSLFASHSITVDRGSNGSVSLSSKSAKAGTTIEVTVKPNTGYRLKASTFTYNDNPITTLKEEKTTTETSGTTTTTVTTQVFTFEMPDEDVTVNVDFEKTSVSYGTLSAGFEQTDEQVTYTWNSSKKVLTLDKVGHSCQLVVTSSKGSSYNPGSWLFDYSSNKTNVATVTSKGVIYARGVGTATITATMKSDSEKKVTFKVTVEEEADADHFELNYSGLKKAKLTTETIAGKKYTIITYTKGNVAKGEKTFDVDVRITSGNNSTNLMLPTTWKINNEDLLEAAKETANNNNNRITVKKGVVGETAVTVSVTNGLTDKKKVVYYEESFIVRVIDVTPRLVQSKLTVNTQCVTGTEFELLSVYGYDVNPESLQVVQAVKNGSITEYEETEAAGYVTIKNIDEKYYMDMTAEGKSAVKDKNGNLSYSNMYIQGDYLDPEGTLDGADYFLTPIKSLVLTAKSLSPKVSTSGKINLFFRGNAATEDKGEVTVKQSLTDLNVVSYELVSTANYNKAGSEKVDSFANNFTITSEGVITRTENDLKYDSAGKPVTSGYLKITYEGYEPCYAKITVPTQNKKPAYVLSKTKLTVNSYSKGYAFTVQLLDKKTKKPLSLANLNSLSFDEDAKGAVSGLFDTLDTAAARESDEITLQVKQVQKGKAVINVEMDTWSEPMKFTFALSVTPKTPAVKAKPTTITLNNLCVGRAGTTVLTVNQADVTIDSIAQVSFSGKLTQSAEAAKISIAYADGVLSAKADQEVAPGSYKFTVTPIVRFASDSVAPVAVKPIVITVKVINTKLTATAKPASVTLNNKYVGGELATTTYTIKNLPVSEEIKINSDNVRIEGANAAAAQFAGYFDFDFAEDKTEIGVSQKEAVYKAASYKYKISGLAVDVDGRAVEIQPFNLTVKVINKVGTLAVKATGAIKIGNSGSTIVYTLTPKNTAVCTTDADDVIVQELDTTNNLNKPYTEELNEDGMRNFVVVDYKRNDNGYITGVEIAADSAQSLDAKKTYKIKIGIVPKDMSESNAVWSSVLTIKPTQVLPKIKTDVSSATMYAGVDINNPRRSQEIKISKTTEETAEISGVILASSNASDVKNAFAVTFDPETQKAKLTLVRPDLLKANTTYAVKLEVKVVGQIQNTAGPQFTINVKILN